MLALSLRLIADSPVDSLSGLAQPGWAFDEQPPDTRSVFGLPLEEELLHDLAQPVLGLLG
jgi:hypothetical protein